MKKVSILLVIGIISCWIFTISAQTRMVITEKFDGNVTWTTSPATAWKKETNYYLSSPNSMRGIVPNKIGDEIELVSPVYDFRNYTDVQLRFSHICKVSPSDIVRVEYRRSMGGGMGAWEELSYETYLGKANIDQYRLHGFNADSYSEWKGNDSLALPNTSWWKEEIFDLWYEVGRTEAQFRFVLKHGATPATQISYGWLIDNIEITAANYQLLPPKVEWMGKNPKDTVYSVGPYTIDAKVKTATNSRILIPWLRYTSTYNGISTTDSVLMDHIRGDSVWSGVLPQFQDGTSVMYSITGKDSLDNYTTIMTGYIIQKPPQVERSGDVIIGTGTTESYYIPFGIYWNNSWNRQLYLASEIDSLSMGGFISKIAWDYISEPTVRDNQTCYLQAVDDVNISSNTYIDPIVAGATQVWTGSINLSEGWSEITLEQPFLLPPGKNLLVYWEHRHGKYNAYYFNTHSTGSTNMAVYCVSDASFPSGSTGTLITNRSNVKLYRMQTNFPDYSAGLIAINSPLRGQTTGNVSTPVTVTLQNKGDSLLTSATINWSVNGGQVNTYSWTGSLLWDFQEQVTIGNFIPRIEKYDTVLVWVSMPNGVLDSTSFDDTLSVIIYGCTPNMSGTYIVGPTGDFNNIQDAISVLSLCAPLGGDITFELEPGIYDKGVSLNDMGQVLGGNKLTITSTTHNANDVIIKPTSGTGIMFSKSNNIIIKDITVDARFATYAIQLTGVCRNILIRDCRLLADSTVTGNTSNPIYSTGGGLDSVFIIHNFISGGYYGIYFYGSSAATMNTNIIIDSNTVQDQYYYAMYVYYYNRCISLSHNTILSKTSNSYTYWYAMYVYYTHADRIIGNKIRQRSTSITYPYGIYFYGQQYTTPPNIALIANNELILSMSSSYYGMYLGYGQAEVINNSIFIKGSGAAKGIYITDVATNNFIIKNNNIVLTSDDNNAHPIYLSSTANLALYDFDYNNMWAPKCVGYAGGTIITLSDWQQTITTDQHSISVYPDYIDSSLYLQLRDYNGYECPKLSSVTLDAEGRIRTGITTTMGAYHGIPPYTVNATLINIAGNKEGLILGETDTIKVTLVNTGATTLTQATLKWEWNGVTQPNVVWTGSLLSENRIDILLGTVTYTSGGYYHIKAWIDNLSPLIDDYKDDDTAAITGYICTIPLNGVYQLGANNADFTSLKEFTNQLKLCGVNGDVTLKIQTGSYMEGLNLTDLDKIFGGYSLTITSTTGINTDVRIKKITLSMINNIIIKDITVDESNGTNAIQFSGACTNVLIRDCRLLANPTTTTTTSNPIYVTSGIGLDSIFIINNLIDGGYYGLYIYGTSSIYNTNLVIDSNTIQNNYYYGLLSYYNKCISLSHNTILSRTSNTATSWYGLYVLYTHANNIMGNRIIQRSNGITYPYGLYFLYQSNASTASDTALIANNEIILSTTNAYYGIYAGYGQAKILHNSIYIGGESGQARGLFLVNNTSTSYRSYFIAKNNNIVIESPAAYPLYVSPFDALQYDIDYNNMYSPTYVGYAGENKLTISDWQQTVTTDRNSIRLNPLFVDKTTSLKLSNPYGITCPPSSITDDIELTFRTGTITALGAYHGFSTTDTVNGMLIELLNWQEGTILTLQDTVKVVMVNMANTALTSATIQWSYNGVQNQVTWSGNLGLAESAIITLGTINYLSAGDYELMAWIAGLGSLTDQNHLDDTVRILGHVCPSPVVGGVYTVGANGVYPTIEAALKRLFLCGMGGDITLALESGTYTYLGSGMDLSNTSDIPGGYTLTITSATNNANDVIIQTDAIGIRLSRSKNLTIKAITVDAKQGTNAIRFASACTNVLIRDCRLLANPTTTTTTSNPIYVTSGIGLDSIFIINNLIDGGYYGLYIYGTSSIYNTNLVIDSNTIQNNYYYALFSYYNEFISISYNTVLSRTSNISTYWYGLYAYYTHADNIMGNHIRQRSNSITYPYGIFLMYQQSSFVSDFPLIANNEIILYMTSSYYGIYIGYGRAKILNNSIYIKGTGEARGIYIPDAPSNMYTIKNNNIVMESPNAYPIYLMIFDQRYDIDYNNMYAPTNVGYAEGAHATISNWQDIVTTDAHSVSILPDFVDSTVNLKLENYTGFECIHLHEIVQDIERIYRSGDTTSMGAYHGRSPMYVNATLTTIAALKQGVILGSADSLKVELINTGATTLTQATIAWKWNNVTRPLVVWTGALTTNQKVIITLGEIIYNQVGTNTATAWIGTLGTLTDNYLLDDTVNLSTYICTAPFSGAYLVGSTGAFSSIDEFIRLLSICGASGDITVNIQPGIYQESINLGNVSSKMGNHSLTITSTTNKAEDVIIKTTGIGIALSGNKNIIIKAITVDATTGTNAVQFLGACTNVIIRDCRLLAHPTITSSTNNPIYAYNMSGLDSLFIINNLIDGGYYGVYIYGSSPTTINTNIIIDSNTIQNNYYYGLDVYYYNQCISLSHNTILSRTSNISTYWYGMYVYYIHANNIIGNRIIQRSNEITYPYGIYFYGQQYVNFPDTMLIANNEIMLSMISTNYGIYAGYGCAKIINNSIYVGGTGAARGMYIVDANTNYFVIKNNNIVLEFADAHPIYLSAMNNLQLYDIDYNNLYAPQYVGYAGGNISTLAAWKLVIPTDSRSVRVQPDFFNTNRNLDLLNNTGLDCDLHPDVSHDISGIPRSQKTTIGAYHYFSRQTDVYPYEFIDLENTYTSTGSIPLKIRIKNNGLDTLKSTNIYWNYNGTSYSYPWTGIIPPSSLSDTLSIGTLNITQNYNELVLYTTLPNGTPDTRTINDTLTKNIVVCDSLMHGIYTMGTTGNFSNLKTALQVLKTCGVNGNVTLAFLPGTYQEEINLTNIAWGYNLAITSSTDNADDVTIETFGTGITMGQNNNITIKAITVDATQGSNAILFASACQNIIIRDCKLLASPTTTSGGNNPIYSTTGGMDNISIINNLLDGGYYGIYLYGSSSATMNTNIIIDSNIVQNNYYYGLDIYYYNKCISISHNTILSRTSNIYTYWYAMYLYYTHANNITGNRIIQRSNGITYPYGLYFYYQTSVATDSDTALISNNEIILNTSSSYYGMYLYSDRAKIINNSIYIGGSGAARGIYFGSATTDNFTIKNNNIVMQSSDAYPIYLSTVNTQRYNLDYNNMYAPKYVGYAGGNQSSIADWQQTVTTDQHSVSVLPSFIDRKTSLEMTDSVSLLCTRDDLAMTDIQGYPRLAMTDMGAYYTRHVLDASAIKITFPSLHIAGISSYPVLTVQNMGKDPITSLTIISSNNGTLTTPVVVSNINLLSLETIEIALDAIIPGLGNNTISAWITDVNSGGMDSLQINDTVILNIHGCTAPMNGVYTIGTGGNFTTIEEAVFLMKNCGSDGAVTLKFKNGIHTGHFDLASAAASMSGYPLTITSENGDTSLAYIQAHPYMPAITLGKNANVIIEKLSICANKSASDSIGGTHAILFTDGCDHIVIDGCALYADQSATSIAKCAILKKENTAQSNNVRIKNNYIDGGYAGIWIYGGKNGIYGNNITIDSNIVQNHYYCGIYSHYIRDLDISHNTILSKTSSSSVTWYALASLYCNGNITDNYVMQRSTTITTPYGIYATYFNQYLTQDTGLIVNNELIIRASGAYPGMYVANSHVNILHNSIYVQGSGQARGIYIAHASDNIIALKNNNIVMESTSAYPIYLSSIADISRYDLDYNNMYASGYAGYAGGSISTLTAWKQTFPTDKHSVQVLPNFVDITTGLKLADNAHLLCPFEAKVPLTIDGENRKAITSMGAYTHVDATFDFMLDHITYQPTEVITNQQIPISVKVVNLGNTVINSAVLGWSVNGVLQPSVPWSAPTSLSIYADAEIDLGVAIVPNADMTTVQVWIESLNNTGNPDAIRWNDTIKETSTLIPLAWYTEPLLQDTVNSLSFSVYAVIREETGALIGTVPTLNIITIAGEKELYTNIPMTYENGKWEGSVPNQYYGSKVIYTLTVSDTVGNTIVLQDSVIIKYIQNSEVYNDYNLSVTYLDNGLKVEELCSPDYSTVSVSIANTGIHDYDFSNSNMNISLRLTTPVVFNVDTVIKTGTLLSGEIMKVEITKFFPIMVAGEYKMKVWTGNSSDITPYDDTLVYSFISGRFGLPIDEDFSNGMPLVLENIQGNTSVTWQTVSQGTGADIVVKPVHGSQMLSFHGSRGAMVQMRTKRLDLSSTLSPALDLWYFHDTILSEDYTDVRVSIDGGQTYTTILSLTKYDATYGWERYTVDLPLFAINQCVILLFEAMEKDLNSNVTQYIDRIRITAKQDIEVSEIFTTDYSVCDMKNKEWKVVISNLTDPVLDFTFAPTTVTLEITGKTNQVFTQRVQTGSISGFSADTFTLASNFDLDTGTYIAKAYIDANPEDNNPVNDTLVFTITVNPKMSVQLIPSSGANACLSGEMEVWQKVILTNTGNMDLFNIDLTLQIDTGNINPSPYVMIGETYTDTLHVGESITYTFNRPYSAPWFTTYYAGVTSSAQCDATLANAKNEIVECVNTKDLYLVSIVNPSAGKDNVGDVIQVMTTLRNRSDHETFTGIDITVLVENSQRVQTAKFIEKIETIGTLATINHNFTNTYTVPNDTLYYLTVYIDHYEDYPKNDTITRTRYTDAVGITPTGAINAFTLGQNVPNPATNSTRIDYSVPEAGNVIFHVHSIHGQLLYSKTIDTKRGTNSIELNTSTFAAGVYFYSMEYKGQRLVRQLIINN